MGEHKKNKFSVKDIWILIKEREEGGRTASKASRGRRKMEPSIQGIKGPTVYSNKRGRSFKRRQRVVLMKRLGRRGMG